MDALHERSPPFRRGKRLWMGVLVLHAALAVGLAGGPWLRGRLRAAEARARFAEFAACLWGGAVAPGAGLGLPEGEELRFADRVLHGPPEWPGACRDPLRRVASSPAWMLFPDVKQAEAVVAEAVARADAALVDVEQSRGQVAHAHVSLTLHRKVEHLLAALAHLASASGARGVLTAPAVTLAERGALVSPTRVPLDVARDVLPRIGVRGDGLVAVAMDRRTLTRVRVGGGGMTLQRVRRPSLVQAVVHGPEGRPWAVWAMPEARCVREEGACAGRATGVARLARGDARLADPVWLAAHPMGDPARAVHVGNEGGDVVVWMVARAIDGGAQVVRFELPLDGEAAEKEAPLEPVAPWPPVPSSGSAFEWLDGSPPRLLMASEQEGQVALTAWEPEALGSLGEIAGRSGQGSVWLQTCVHREGVWVVFGQGDALAAVQLANQEEEPPVPPSRPAPLSQFGGPPSSLACDGARLHAVRLRPSGDGLVVASCAPSECQVPVAVDAPARHVAAVREGEVTVVAFAAGARDHVQVGVLTDDGGLQGPPRVVAPCFGSDGGMCGAPVLAARNGRVVLGARDGGDLLLVETVNGGRTWLPMRGLR
jgi:hypothetical protein